MSWTSRAWRVAWRAAGAVWAALTAGTVAVSVLGATLVVGPAGVVGTALAAAGGTALALALRPEPCGRTWPRTRLVGCAGLVAVTVVGALTSLGQAGLALVMVLTATGHGLRVWHRALVRAAVRPGGGRVRRPRHPQLPPGPPDLTQLCRAWRTTHEALGRCTDPARRALLVQARQDCLDEMARLEPAGLQRWLDTVPDPADDPAPFLVTGTRRPGGDRASDPGRPGPAH
ncbi:hypothetical protein GB931_10960 [Modestobacter sp. I12A-02628]|uniref:Uncharacterized protein n=1 Tax=Goekera deserti TaxID=2497753 RepID=A0A7K3WEQ8_9ACTN|nr:hypothetical protein [Goekera deserti]MPQ98427.1 hypothetical protein [Goekera deserti]NDI48254.1 hypothetical protein [Goekera deserti]NEL54003.1 hypothetical protein [Goekera deserti]